MSSADPNDFSGHLADYRWPRLGIACGPCGRQGSYNVATLRSMLANPPMSEVPRLIAIKGGCPLAVRFPGRDCGASFVSKRSVQAVQYLSTVYHEGWQLLLTCERHHQGLKAAKPCSRPFNLSLESLVAAFGHSLEIEQLNRRLECPGCGSKHYSLTWIAPKEPPAAEPIPLRKAV